jgi:hypothetical protein
VAYRGSEGVACREGSEGVPFKEGSEGVSCRGALRVWPAPNNRAWSNGLG